MNVSYSYSLLLGLFFFLFCGKGYTQKLSVVSVSEEKKNAYQSVLNKNKKVVAFIEGTLVQNGLPKMLRNLSLIESGFDKEAVSSANAGGIWQFMESHAAQYGLKSEDRYDVYHSTQTVVKSLKDLYEKYGNWITVVAAYNCGEGNVQKAIDKAKSNRYEEFYIYLPSETISHVHKFMEACWVTGELNFLITNYKLSAFKQHSNSTEKAQQNHKTNPAFASTEINTAYSLNVIAEEMDITRADLEKWNPEMVNELKKNGSATFYLPVDKMPDFLLLKNTILNQSLQIDGEYDE